MDQLKALRTPLDQLPWIVTLLLTIFVDGVWGALYRITRGDVTGIVVGILWFVTGGFFGIGWVIDIICVVLNKKITVLA